MQKRKIHFANFLKYQLYRQAKLYSTFSSTALRISAECDQWARTILP